MKLLRVLPVNNSRKYVFFEVALLFVFSFFLVPFVTHAEFIDSFDVTISLHKDSSFNVVEEIDYDFGKAPDKHGIFRTIPLKHPDEASAWYLDRYINIEIDAVTQDGLAVPYESDIADGTLILKIGNPNKTVSGEHTYKITYDVRGGLSYFKNKDAEIYWNATGNEWGIPMKRTSVSVIDIDGVFLGPNSCYLGLEGSTKSCGQAVLKGNTTTFSSGELEPHQGITVAHSIDQTKVARVVLERMSPAVLFFLCIPTWFLLLGFFVYRYRTKYKTGNTIIAQYEPYGDIEPMYTGVLFDDTVDAKDISAGIVYLAEQGYLRIRKTQGKAFFFFEVDDYEITIIKDTSSINSLLLKRVLSLLFSDSTAVQESITLSALKKDSLKVSHNQAVLRNLKKSASEDLVAKGFFQNNLKKISILGFIVFGATVLIFWLGLAHFFNPVYLVIPASFLVLSFMYRRRTRKGYEALDHLQGFKLFLSMTEKERYEFHNAPDKSPEEFMKYLPYAIAFGVEKKWAEVFKDISIPNPDWYDGGNVSTFSALSLTNSLGAFSTTFAASSGTSASSGGGSSGGGGGGGGSW